jgi:ATP diphosphatase
MTAVVVALNAETIEACAGRRTLLSPMAPIHCEAAMTPSRDIHRLIEIMAALRTPETGCPWDLAQDFATIAPYTLEEAAEVADAIARGDLDDLRDELGDLLLQVVFHARMAEEAGSFGFGDVVEAITAKMIRRHPHVFGDRGGLSQDEVNGLWERIKAEERAARAGRRGETAAARRTLDGVPAALPALSRAVRLQEKAAKVGFDWPDAGDVLAKIREETAEVEAAMNTADAAARAEEIGDLLFAVTNLARHLGVDAELALRGANAKFERRFAAVEDALAERSRTPADSNLAEMDRLWDQAKAAERSGCE